MPNYVKNILSVDPTHDAVLSALLNDEREVDFNRVIPMPADMRGFEPHLGVISRAKSLLGIHDEPRDGASYDINEITKRLSATTAIKALWSPVKAEDIPDIFRAAQLYQDYGFLYWYDWTCENWGTKWNASQHDVSDARKIEFQTAWSAPMPVISKLSEAHPKTPITITYADEDLGSNLGVVTLKAGVVIATVTPETDMEKRRFAFELWHPGSDPKDYEMNDQYEYVN